MKFDPGSRTGRNPIGFDATADETLSCVVVAKFTPSSPSTSDHPQCSGAVLTADTLDAPVYTRQRDTDLNPEDFDHERGEHSTRQVQTQSRKAAAQDWVGGRLLARPDAAAPQADR